MAKIIETGVNRVALATGGDAADAVPLSASNPLPISAAVSASIASGQVTLTTSATLIAAARAARRSIIITPTASTVFYIGAAAVSTANGLYVPAGASVTLETAAAVYGIVGAATLAVSYLEAY